MSRIVYRLLTLAMIGLCLHGTTAEAQKKNKKKLSNPKVAVCEARNFESVVEGKISPLAVTGGVELSAVSLIELPYPINALAPVISEETVSLHHGKHLAGYVNNLNKLRKGTELEHASLGDVVRKAEGGLFNNAGQVLNHNLYFLQFNPKPRTSKPEGHLAKAIDRQWGGFDAMRALMEERGGKLFGSGWLWLVVTREGQLDVVSEANGSNPIVREMIPLLGFDLWEHAYYLDYRNRRAEHIKALWQIIDWDVIEARYNACRISCGRN